ncbi:MAG TPA: glycosyltransferase family A protein, partial [Actinomycetota bacterium]|nr:glycosyltransferase family A protein [Actinomycetota bacterium]
MAAGEPTAPDAPPSEPVVTVGIPVYNGEEHLAEAIRSVLAQDFAGWELVICDNASEDGTAEVARRFAAADARIRHVRNPQNIGLMGNFRKALEEARGEYFTWLAHDDTLSSPQYLSKVVGYLQTHPDVVACTTGFRLIGSEYGVAGDTVDFPQIAPERWPRSREEYFRWPHSWIESLTIYGVIRRRALASVTLPERTFKGRPHIFWWETDVCTQLCRLGRIVALPEVLRSYRLAVVTGGTVLATWVSTFDLYRIGLGMKLVLIGRAATMPGPVGARLRLTAVALANLVRANRGQPYGHAFVSRNWEQAVGQLRQVAGERRRWVAILQQAILDRRRLAEQTGRDPGPLPARLAEALEQLDEAKLPPPAPTSRYSRNPITDFFRPPSPAQIRLGRELQAELGRLNLLCGELLERMEFLDA